jgi:hypothetical protein
MIVSYSLPTPGRRDAKKKYQFTHPIAAIPPTMTSQAVPDMKQLLGYQ